MYDRFRIDFSLHLDPALLLPDAPDGPAKEELGAFLLALQRAWGGLAHVCIVPEGGEGAVPSKGRPQVRPLGSESSVQHSIFMH